MVGSSLTQLIMIGALMTTAASRGTFRESDAGGLRSIASVAVALSTSWGPTTAKVLVSLAFLGAALSACGMGWTGATCPGKDSNPHGFPSASEYLKCLRSPTPRVA